MIVVVMNMNMKSFCEGLCRTNMYTYVHTLIGRTVGQEEVLLCHAIYGRVWRSIVFEGRRDEPEIDGKRPMS